MFLFIVVYLAIALCVYLALVAVEVKYLDLLDARTDPQLSAEAMWSMGIALLWPCTIWFFFAFVVGFLIIKAVHAIRLTNIGYLHFCVGRVVNVVVSKISLFCRGIRRKWRDYRNVRTPAAVTEVSGQNQEGLEANAG